MKAMHDKIGSFFTTSGAIANLPWVHLYLVKLSEVAHVRNMIADELKMSSHPLGFEIDSKEMPRLRSHGMTLDM